MKNGTTVRTTKRYPRVTAGPLRHQYVHRVVAAALIGRALTRDEEVHHKDGDRRNFWFENLMVLGEKDHGWVSAKQAHFMRHRDAREKTEWDEFMAAEAIRFQNEALLAKNSGQPWYNENDGQMQQRWENRNAATA